VELFTGLHDDRFDAVNGHAGAAKAVRLDVNNDIV
jgi:hypothetical protein